MPEHFLELLRTVCADRARHPALRHRGPVISYDDLENRARRFAALLQQSGIEPGDRVALALSEKDTFLIAHLGALFAGAVTLPLNPGLTRDELMYFLKDSGSKVVVAGEE